MPLGAISPFRPAGTVSLQTGTTSQNVALTGGGDSLVVTNTGSNVTFVRFGADPTITATSSDMPVLGSSQIILSVNSLINYVAAISPTGTGTVLFSRGDGSTI